MSMLLEIEGLDAGYGASQVLFGTQLRIRHGEVVTLLGRNGMGKSTLVRAIFGLIPTTAGRVMFDGVALRGLPADRIARHGLALVPEGRQIFPNLSVEENLVAFACNRNGSKAPWTLSRIYELFPALRERRSNAGNQLSGGEQQMLAIGRAMMTNPRLLVLDEATEGLAPLVREEIWRCLATLREIGQTILVIDKYVERLIKLADHHTILERGRVVWHGSSAQLDGDHALWHQYLGI